MTEQKIPFDLIERYKELAAGGENFHGLSIIQHAKGIHKLIRETGSTSLLDYGCGRGDQYRSPHKLYHQWGLARKNVTLYDPAFPSHDQLPRGEFDIVVCSDVLEHIPKQHVSATLITLFAYARKAVWASVCTRPAKKFFPNSGINMHVTVEQYRWWFEQMQTAADGKRFELVETP